MLSDSESDGESIHQLTVNEHYAKAFEYKKEREELEKLKAKYGSDIDEDESETDSESLESEDEDGAELTPAMDAAILRTLARIKRKDPEIYDKEKDVFQEEKQKIATTSGPTRRRKDKSKPVTIRQVALENALDTGSRSPSPQPASHAQEQQNLRSETIAAFHQAVAEDDDDGLLIPREKTKDEIEKEEEDYRAFLEREVGTELVDLVTIDADDAPKPLIGDSEEATPKKPKKTKKSKEKSEKKTRSRGDEDQEFLMNYILNRGWIDKSSGRIPTYKEVTKTSEKAETDNSEHSDDPAAPKELSEDDFDEIADIFESSYNFRFEEPDAAVIKTYPRTLPSLVRREDTTRKEARQRKKQRREEELVKKKEEVRRLKALKMKEIRAKLERIGREAGKDVESNPALHGLDLEGDWDPDAHDQQMSKLYGDDDAVDEDKPHWDDDIDIGDIPMDDEPSQPTKKEKKKKKKKKKSDDNEDAGVNVDDMDADAIQTRKKKLDEYMDDVYGLDFNDMVGDLPTRFRYVPVQPQSFSLSPVEVLLATDAELNEFMGIKRYAPYRVDAKWDPRRAQKLGEFRKKIADRIGREWYGEPGGEGGERPAKKRRKGRKERMKMKAAAEGGDEGL